MKSKDAREAEILNTLRITGGVDPVHVTNLENWFGTLSKIEREALHNYLTQGAYQHAKPGVFVRGDARTAANLARQNEQTQRKIYRALRAVMVAKSMYDDPGLTFQQHLQRAATVVVGDMMQGQARLKAECASFQTSMKKLIDTNASLKNWVGWEPGKFRPLLVGCNIGRRGAEGPGTLGCFVRKPNGDVYILSNEHVMQQRGIDAAFSDDAIVQPAHQCGGTFFDVIAESIEAAPNLDAAIAKVKSGIVCNPVTLEGRRITGVGVAAVGQLVYKRGCATKARIGEVTNDHAPDVPKGPRVTVTNQILVRSHATDASHRLNFPFQVQGDSGSIALDDTGRVVALMHGQAAGQPEIGQGTHIAPILAHFGVTILTASTVAP